tara:strand:- start:98 stop:481 length:384 start_codon:yes stop_codon:yes gene_type:complete
MESIAIPDLKDELDTNDYIYTKNKKGDVQSLGFNIKNLFIDNNLPILEKHNDYIIPVGIHLFIPKEDNYDEYNKIDEEDNVVPVDIYDKLLDLHKKNIIQPCKETKNNSKKNKRKKKHSRGTRKKLK